jgi:hypothetical protein
VFCAYIRGYGISVTDNADTKRGMASPECYDSDWTEISFCFLISGASNLYVLNEIVNVCISKPEILRKSRILFFFITITGT